MKTIAKTAAALTALAYAAAAVLPAAAAPYYSPGRGQPAPQRPVFNTPGPNWADYEARYRAQAEADYRRDVDAWTRQRDAAIRAQADWDARYAYTYNQPSYPAYPGYPAYGNAPATTIDCSRRDGNTTVGGLIGALVGAAIGRNVAANNTRTEGTILGGVVGAALGANIGRANTSCDERGLYYTYDQTYPYAESSYDRARNSGRYNYDYYNRQRCRLAMAPYGPNEYRYVRVCPDNQNRYRITD